MMCSKWLPINHDSHFCSSECERQYIIESKYWETYKEKNRLANIQCIKEERNKHNLCLNCGSTIIQNDKGRFRRYCGNHCKQEAYRNRKKRV